MLNRRKIGGKLVSQTYVPKIYFILNHDEAIFTIYTTKKANFVS